MSSDISPLDEPDRYDGIVCVKPGCGSTWFSVQAVRADQDLRLTEGKGHFVCIECGTVFLRRRGER